MAGRLPESVKEQGRGRGRGQMPYYLPAVGRHISQATTVTKRNFSDLRKMDDLLEVCSKRVSTSVTSIKPSQETVKEFLIEVYPDVDKLKSQWAALFKTSSQSFCLTKAPVMNDLQAHIIRNPGTELYHNGAVKMMMTSSLEDGREPDFQGAKREGNDGCASMNILERLVKRALS